MGYDKWPTTKRLVLTDEQVQTASEQQEIITLTEYAKHLLPVMMQVPAPFKANLSITDKDLHISIAKDEEAK